MRPLNDSLTLVLSLGLLFCSVQFISAQTGSVRGSVSDLITGEPLIQAAVIYGAAESTSGVLTDFDGVFSIELTPGIYNLRVSYVGYEPKEIDVEIDLTFCINNFPLHIVFDFTAFGRSGVCHQRG